MKVTNVSTLPGYKLHVIFDDEVSGVIDLESFIKNGIFSILKNQELFNNAYTTGYSIAWDDELEIDAITIYAEISNKKPEDILSVNFNYASN